MIQKDELQIIETLNPKEVVISPVGNQSLKVKYPCGCYFVQHGFTKTTQINRVFFTNLCNNHKII